MKNLALTLATLLFSTTVWGNQGLTTCFDKKVFLSDICKIQKNDGNTTHFQDCANEIQYEITTEKVDVQSTYVTTDIQCKMVEIRKQDSIESRTSYFDKSNNKVVVYKHDNGLSNAYVYGKTGYYHITEFATGDSIYNFHSFDL